MLRQNFISYTPAKTCLNFCFDHVTSHNINSEVPCGYAESMRAMTSNCHGLKPSVLVLPEMYTHVTSDSSHA